ncbi:unnamed protein product [Phytomonas sp. Hart1]|nr:unnamed protein product [Phytomonas sp. Hart1]|eukprot:CCW71843.1 unnamed protein product [Phytomonas sp. isolate Hart1]
MNFVSCVHSIPEKFRVLIIFSLFAMNNGFSWIMFDPVAKWMETNVDGLSKNELELLSSWQPVAFLCMCIPVMKIVTQHDGLRFSVQFGTLLEIAGAFLKLIGILARHHNAGLVFLNMGQIFSGLGSPVAAGAVSALSATWFPPKERTRATAVAILFNSVGNALCYLFIPIVTQKLTMVCVIIYELLIAILVAVLAWKFMPKEHLHGDDQQMQSGMNCSTSNSLEDSNNETQGGGEIIVHPNVHVSFHRQLAQLFRIPSCLLLLIVYAWLSGGFSAWISLFDETYNKWFTETFIGIMSFSGIFMYVIGGLLMSWLVDLYFSRQMKYVIFFCITMNSLGNLIFISCTPNDKGFSLLNWGKGFIIFSTGLCGFWNGAAAPLFFELIAEISFPIEEGVSGICVSLMENVGALLFYQVISKFFEGQFMTIAYSFGMIVVIALCAAVKQRYKRTYHTYICEMVQHE